MRYPLVDGQGNFGSIDGDPPAAMRYTEARPEAIAEALMADLDKETVDFVPELRRDHRRAHRPAGGLSEPAGERVVRDRGGHGDEHPAAQPARGHRRADRGDRAPQSDTRDARLRALLKTIPGPDFPSGGFIVGREGIFNAYKTGRGSITLRALAATEENKKGDRIAIIVTEIPYQVNKARLVEKIAELVREKVDRGHLRSAGRVGPRRHADRHRAAPRRGGRGGAQQPLQAHPAADHVRHHHAGDRRRPAEGAAAARHHRALHRVPARGGPAPHRVRAAQGGGARPHPRGPEDRPRSPRRGDPPDSRVEEPGGGARRADDAVLPDRRSSRRPSSTCSCSGSPAWSARRSSTSWPSCRRPSSGCAPSSGTTSC